MQPAAREAGAGTQSGTGEGLSGFLRAVQGGRSASFVRACGGARRESGVRHREVDTSKRRRSVGYEVGSRFTQPRCDTITEVAT